MTVVGSQEELRERAVDPASTASRSCTGPGSTPSAIAVPMRGEIAERVPEVGDCWLDAGIVPFSTLGWRRDELRAGGLRGAARASG